MATSDLIKNILNDIRDYEENTMEENISARLDKSLTVYLSELKYSALNISRKDKLKFLKEYVK